MRIEAARDALHVRLGATFGAADLARLEEAVAALGPFSHVTIDFADVRACDDAALGRLARELPAFERGAVTLRGLTARQWRLLTYLGMAGSTGGRPEAGSP